MPTKVITQLESKNSEPCLYARNRRIFAKTWDSAIHRLSLPGVSYHPEFNFIIPIVNHKRSTTKNSFPDLPQSLFLMPSIYAGALSLCWLVWLVGWLVCLVGWLVWLVGWLVCLVGWLVCQSVRIFQGLVSGS
ncbi:unnamed protein product [Acanthocheilonema viteae]|uniref:Uncharacterized protein n=1 Tax=Acanthocheilonema viteae TaxID=6277 RepID=A0A498SR05_ACAVI|nr:unnamed protein product [Acanthocheilonema viteae]